MRVIPPLSQSLYEQMACSESYLYQTVEGHKQPDSIASERGSEVHFILAAYVRHCVAKKVAVDFPHFDKLAAAAGPVAGPILDGMRDTFVVDYKHVLFTELRLRLDSELRPTLLEQKADGTLHLHVEDELPALDEVYSRSPAAHAGTLDVLKINGDATEAVVEDFKTHPRPFDADTYQAKLYSFMALKHIPTLRKVTFRLVFVRYGAEVTREASFTRDDMPALAAEIRRARERQLALEAAGTGPALPGSHCGYCPKLSRPTLCSISEFNPQLTTKPEERLRFNVWASEMAKVNRGVLKDMVDASGRSISITDANGRRYEFGCHATESQVFPLDETFLGLARNHMMVSPDTWESMKLRISSSKLKSLLKAKKREGFRIALENSVVEIETRPKFGIRRPDGDVDTGYSQEEDF